MVIWGDMIGISFQMARSGVSIKNSTIQDDGIVCPLKVATVSKVTLHCGQVGKGRGSGTLANQKRARERTHYSIIEYAPKDTS